MLCGVACVRAIFSCLAVSLFVCVLFCFVGSETVADGGARGGTSRRLSVLIIFHFHFIGCPEMGMRTCDWRREGVRR